MFPFFFLFLKSGSHDTTLLGSEVFAVVALWKIFTRNFYNLLCLFVATPRGKNVFVRMFSRKREKKGFLFFSKLFWFIFPIRLPVFRFTIGSVRP